MAEHIKWTERDVLEHAKELKSPFEGTMNASRNMMQEIMARARGQQPPLPIRR